LNSNEGAKALPVLNDLAAQNNPRAQFHLARLYHRGYGVPKDQEKAMLLYKQSADQGDPLAEVDLGQIYEQGAGVPKSLGQAASWYQRAARGGYAPGLSCLSNLYARGLGVNPNPTMAYMLIEMASISHAAAAARPDRQNNNAYTNTGCGSFWSGSVQTELAKKMSLVQVQRAKDLAKTWNFDQPIPE
jgi:TPR repeat protein